MSELARGDVYEIPLEMRGRGGQQGDHFVIVVQIDAISRHAAEILVVPITSQVKNAAAPVERAMLPLQKRKNTFLKHDSIAAVSWLAAHPKKKFTESRRRGRLDRDDLVAVNAKLAYVFGLVLAV